MSKYLWLAGSLFFWLMSSVAWWQANAVLSQAETVVSYNMPELFEAMLLRYELIMLRVHLLAGVATLCMVVSSLIVIEEKK